MPQEIISLKNITKTVVQGFIPRKKQIIKNLSLSVKQGEIFGFIGPNGAGKTTTLKIILDLVHPTSGEVYLFGKSNRIASSRERIGFLSESPYFYNYLTGIEFLNFYAQLFGIEKQTRLKKTDSLLKLVGISKEKSNLSLRKYSKGMLQRIGIAQALINDPELLILDEPMSGLDPVGRKDIREIISRLKQEGKTILFATHILSDVEMICDSIGILVNGELKKKGKLKELLDSKIESAELSFTGVPLEQLSGWKKSFDLVGINTEEITISIRGENTKNEIIEFLSKNKGKIISVIPQRQLLEKFFMDKLEE